MFNMLDIRDRRILVTGGSSGIGLGIARALLSAGAIVTIVGRTERVNHAAEGLARECDAGKRVHALTCDVAEDEELEAAFRRSVEVMGHIDACFANAGVSGFAGGADGKGTQIGDMTLEEFRRVQRTNVEGLFLTFRAAARHMIGRGVGASLVATSSTAAIEGTPRNTHYALPRVRRQHLCGGWPSSWRDIASA